MKNIEDCWGERLLYIRLERNTDYFGSGDEILVDRITFVFETGKLVILPISDTDEINVECLEYENTENNELEGSEIIFNKYIGKTLSMTWKCINANGYFDLYAISLERLHPSLMILSEGTVLKLFATTQIEELSKNDEKPAVV